MIDSIVKSEHYILVKTSNKTLTSEDIQTLATEIQDVLSTTEPAYLLVDLGQLNNIETNALSALSGCAELALEKKGALVFIHPDHFLMDEFSEAGIVLVPTENEAVEYIMMDKLEKDFLSEE